MIRTRHILKIVCIALLVFLCFHTYRCYSWYKRYAILEKRLRVAECLATQHKTRTFAYAISSKIKNVYTRQTTSLSNINQVFSINIWYSPQDVDSNLDKFERSVLELENLLTVLEQGILVEKTLHKRRVFVFPSFLFDFRLI